MSAGLVLLALAGGSAAWLLGSLVRNVRSQRLVGHWCYLAAETGAYVSVPSGSRDWRSLALRHRRPPFMVSASMSESARGNHYIELSSSIILGARCPSFSLTRRRDDSDDDQGARFLDYAVVCESELLPEVLTAAEDELRAAAGYIDWLQVHDRSIHVRTNLPPTASVAALESCLEVVYAVAGDDLRGLEAMGKLPASSVSLEGDLTGDDYPRVVVAVPTPVELSIRTDHDAPRTVAVADASREGADFSCDIGADGSVSGRPATLIDGGLHELLRALPLCRLRKRGNRVELVWPRVESSPDALLAGARLVASFRPTAGPYR